MDWDTPGSLQESPPPYAATSSALAMLASTTVSRVILAPSCSAGQNIARFADD